jgi:hypothetical protein
MTGYESKRAAAQDKLENIIPWKLRPQANNKALANTINIWAQPVYQPPKDDFARTGALDFKKVKSK